MNLMRLGRSVLFTGLTIISIPGEAEEDFSYDFSIENEQNEEFRGYPKRDRAFLGSTKSVIPSQLHEVVGNRTDADITVIQSKLKRNGETAIYSSPVVAARMINNEGSLITALTASGSTGALAPSDSNLVEDYSTIKVIPQVAYSFTENITAGAAGQLGWVNLSIKNAGEPEREFDLESQRATFSASYHEPTFEVGVSYATEVEDADPSLDYAVNAYALTGRSISNSRALYIPAMATLFGRGNLSDEISVLSTLSVARYDGNNEGAITLLDSYRTNDRLASKVQVSYWTPMRSRLSASVEYRGAATAEPGLDENGLGYRVVNLYGGSLEATFSVDKRVYIGGLIGYMRGERDGSFEGKQYAHREETLKFAGNVSVKM